MRDAAESASASGEMEVVEIEGVCWCCHRSCVIERED
jgi:hypothetical protein